jgi:hypothetical protein
MNEMLKLLDNGFGVCLRRNDMGNYTAIAVPPGRNLAEVEGCIDAELEEGPAGTDVKAFVTNGWQRYVTDDFDLTSLARRLTEKVLFGRVV